MAGKREKPEDIVSKLRQVEVLQGQGMTVVEALAQDVAKHKQHFFRETDRADATINYADALSGSLCLIPEGEALEALAQDYKKCRKRDCFRPTPSLSMI